MSWLDDLLFGVRVVQDEGVAVAVSSTINVIGPNVSAVYNAAQGRIDITITEDAAITEGTADPTPFKLAKRRADGSADFAGECTFEDVVLDRITQAGNGAAPTTALVNVGKTAITIIAAGRDGADDDHELLKFSPADKALVVGDATKTELVLVASLGEVWLNGTTGAELQVGGDARVKATSAGFELKSANGAKKIEASNVGIGLNGNAPVAQGVIGGSRANPEETLKFLLQFLEDRGDITDNSTA
jgi:hypothetical protein